VALALKLTGIRRLAPFEQFGKIGLVQEQVNIVVLGRIAVA